MNQEHKLARALIVAHVDNPDVAEIVLDTVDGWAEVVAQAQEALEQQQRTADDLRRYYTVADLRTLLGKSDSGVRAMLEAGLFPVTRVGGSIRVPIATVDRYLADQTSTAAPAPPRPRGPRFTADEQDVLRRWPGLAS